MKILLIALTFVLLVGCSKNDSLALIMEAGFTEQFSYSCSENTKCVETAESYMDICFDKKLAVAAIDANKTEKKEINTKHILEIQKCLSQKAGIDYWKEIDMPNFILSQVNQV